MRLAILYTPAPPDAPPDDLDGLVQLESVATVLRELGHEVVEIPFGLNLEAVRDALLRARCDCAFNLVESVAGQDRLLHLAPALLEALGIAFTGAGLGASLLTTNKLMAKRMLHGCGLPTPSWLEPFTPSPVPPAPGQRLIVKSAWDHGSKGLDADALVQLDDGGHLLTRLRELSSRPGQEWFAEAFVDGREFNLSVLSDEDGPRVLPPAEIRFEGFGEDRPRMVGYKAKWDPDSFEYAHTVRSFDFPAQDAGLLRRLTSLALESWHLFSLRGFARVDFRVDPAGSPTILEVNVNPCLSPDAGFAAAVARAGLSYREAIERIVLDSLGSV